MSPSALFGAIGGPGLAVLAALQKNSLRSFVTTLKQAFASQSTINDAIRLRLLVHHLGPQEQPAQATRPDREEQSDPARLCWMRP